MRNDTTSYEEFCLHLYSRTNKQKNTLFDDVNDLPDCDNKKEKTKFIW
jgi:hypothetical protein